MKNQPSSSSLIAVIGDLVGSRRPGARTVVQRSLMDALAAANELVPARQPLEPTIGDEFQGVYDTFEAASLAALVVRLALPEDLDSRAGLGRGQIEIVGESRYGLTQDGPAWWAAREAVIAVKDGEKRLPGWRTAVGGTSDDETDQGVGWMNGFLMTRDALVSRFDARQRRLVLGLLRGDTRAHLAEQEGISASAVSQSLRRSGAAEVLESAAVINR